MTDEKVRRVCVIGILEEEQISLSTKQNTELNVVEHEANTIILFMWLIILAPKIYVNTTRLYDVSGTSFS
jgi:hypothetical protein